MIILIISIAVYKTILHLVLHHGIWEKQYKILSLQEEPDTDQENRRCLLDANGNLINDKGSIHITERKTDYSKNNTETTG